MIEHIPLPGSPPRRPPAPSSGDELLLDLARGPGEAAVVIVPVPYEATVSSRAGTVNGPRAALEATAQIDMHDLAFGEPWLHGLHALDEPGGIRALSEKAGAAARQARAGGGGAEDVDRAGGELAAWLSELVSRLLESGRGPLVLGGEHAVSLGAFQAAARLHPGLGLLHIDAHADLREAYEGWRSSHASVMARALEEPGVGRLVQVGLRDVSPEESGRARSEGSRVRWYTDDALAARRMAGEPFSALAGEIVEALPGTVWVSFDVDGLDPSLCPGTGTPVPGGLSWHEAGAILGCLRASGRRVLGADVVEIGPDFWDGLVAAKLLYRLSALLVPGPGT